MYADADGRMSYKCSSHRSAYCCIGSSSLPSDDAMDPDPPSCSSIVDATPSCVLVACAVVGFGVFAPPLKCARDMLSKLGVGENASIGCCAATDVPARDATLVPPMLGLGDGCGGGSGA